MKRKLMLLVAILCVGIGFTTAQTKRVTGVVLSEEDGQPVIGASVLVKGTQIGTITGVDGDFVLPNVPSSAKTLQVSYVGMQSAEQEIKSYMKVFLKSDSKLLDEVMVVAFGTAKKSAFTGSAKVVGSEKLEMSQVTSVTNALAGAVPGVQLTSNNGAPGASSSIQIRGFGSLNAKNDPLVIVDGAPYSGDMSNINPSDVESMTVLKDAASNALYGARGANGVIMITTKKAKSGDAVVTFDAKVGANTRALKQYNVITDPRQYYEMHYGALRDYYMVNGMTAEAAWQRANANLCGKSGNGGLGYNVFTIPENEVMIGLNGKMNPNATLGRRVTNPFTGNEYWLTPDDWLDESTRTGLRQEYNVSVSASNEKSSFYVSMGYLENEGITEKSDLKRLTARMRADYQAKKWMKIGGNFNYARYEGNSLSNNGSSTSSGNIWATATQMAPIYPLYIRNADGSVKVDANGFRMMDYGNGDEIGVARGFLSDANPLQDTQLNTKNYEGNAFSGNGFVNFNFVPGLTITLNGTFNVDETRYTNVLNPYYGQFDSTGGTVSKDHSRTYDYNLQQLVNYSTTLLDDHNIDVMVGHEYYDSRYYLLGASKSKMFSQENKELSGAVVDGKSAYSYKERSNNEGYFGRLQYNYDERIFGSASFRRDASSKFHPDHRWGNFWSVGAAWLLNKESWYNLDWMEELKLKASYGVQGNDNIDAFLYTDMFDIQNSNGEIGTAFVSKGSEDITWETNGNFNVGVEFQMFKRFSGSLEYYYRKTTDMLFSFGVSPSLGYDSYYDNVGDMYNTGIELELNVNVLNQKNLRWDVNLNLSTLKNRITMLHPDKKTSSLYDADGKEYKGYNSDSFFVAEDLSIYTWRLREYAGVNENGESMWYKNVLEDGKVVGRETTTKYDEADYYVTNESTVPKVFGGFGTTLNAYGFDFSINCSYQIGGKQYDSTYAGFMGAPTSDGSGSNFHADLLNSWSANNTGSSIPRFVYNDTYSNGSSTRFLTNASYLNIENINLGYTVPVKWTKKAFINSMRVYLSCENVAYWSKRKGFDPRQSYTGAANATYYSPMRTISGGITMKF